MHLGSFSSHTFATTSSFMQIPPVALHFESFTCAWCPSCALLRPVTCNLQLFGIQGESEIQLPHKTVKYLWDQNPPPSTRPISVMIAFWRYRHLCYTSYLPSSSFCDRSTLYCNYSGLVNKALLLVKSSVFSIFKCPKSINQCLKRILSTRVHFVIGKCSTWGLDCL